MSELAGAQSVQTVTTEQDGYDDLEVTDHSGEFVNLIIGLKDFVVSIDTHPLTNHGLATDVPEPPVASMFRRVVLITATG